MMKTSLILISLSASEPLFARASAGLLPPGVGLYQLGYRAITNLDTKFNDQGGRVPLGESFDRNFTGRRMLNGSQGKDLQKLSTVLMEYEGGSADPGSLTADLTLGQLRGDVRAQVDTQILGLGFGLSQHVTLFAGLPYVRARVSTKLNVNGYNNAQQTLDKIGDAAFPDLRDGLVRAASLNEQQIKDNFAEQGYQPVDEWKHNDIGDLRVGVKSGFEKRLNKKLSYVTGVIGRIDVPTGYVERADTLTDIGFGRGYYSLNMTVEQILNVSSFHFGTDAMYAYNFDAKLEKRIPEGEETTIAGERTTSARINPGDDTEFGLFAGFSWAWVNSRYRMGFNRHFSDSFSGSLAGNYDALSEETDNWKLFHEVSLALDTSKAYRSGEFGFPMILSAKIHAPIQGHNSPEQRFFEISLASFFSTRG